MGASPLRVEHDGGVDRVTLNRPDRLNALDDALIDALAPGAPERLRSMFVRFSRPVFPGETIATEIYGTGGAVRFCCRVVERDVVVLDRGAAVFA